MHPACEETIDWSVYLRLPIVDALVEKCNGDDFWRLKSILASGHFGIISPHRSFAHHHEDLVTMRQGGDPAIFAGDQMIRHIVGSTIGTGRQSIAKNYNAKAWKHLCQTMYGMGFNPLPICGIFTEQGGQPTLEAALVLDGRSNADLDFKMMRNLGRICNQDRFIYCGPDVPNDVQSYRVLERCSSGLPSKYINEPFGKIKTADDIQALLKRIYA